MFGEVSPKLPGILSNNSQKFSVVAVTTYTSGTNTFTPNVNTEYLRVRLVGGAGSGGGATSGPAQLGLGGGGGAGGYCESWMTRATCVGAGTTAQVVVGSGGSTASAGSVGNAGNASTFISNGGSGTTLMNAGGGGGGGTNDSVTQPSCVGGTGGTAASATINIPGQSGFPNAGQYGNTLFCAMGGSNPLGYGGGGHAYGTNNGNAGNNYGGGGEGGMTVGSANATGGAGAGGICIIEEYRVN
jgi:hypothetical protein